MPTKTFVLDTNVLVHNPNALFLFEKNEVVIPLVVIEELDNLKKFMDERGRNARMVARHLDELRALGELSKGVEVASGTYRSTLISTRCSPFFSKSCTPMLIMTS